MPLAILKARTTIGIKAHAITVETHISGGLPSFSIVGLPETLIKESKDRVRSAIMNSRFEFPARRITINLGPADLPKFGSGFDLPIALTILMASGQLTIDDESWWQNYEFFGELTLSGALRPIRGMIPLLHACSKENRACIIPKGHEQEAALFEKGEFYAAENLSQVYEHLTNQKILPRLKSKLSTIKFNYSVDMSEVKGQFQAKQALEIAAAGGHSVLMVGPPGTGKSMLASRLPTLLPPLSLEEALEVASIQSIRGIPFNTERWQERAFRTPHHTSSAIALVGGGSPPKPGEISLAHHGILFLDELPEFARHTLDTLREPLEAGSITIARAAHYAEYPAKFQFIGAMNPCPCGHHGNPHQKCRCTSLQIKNYKNKLSGPFLDRIDIHLEVPMLKKEALLNSPFDCESSEDIQARVIKAYQKQIERQGYPNAQLRGHMLEKYCVLGEAQKALLENALLKLKLSARSLHRIFRVSRTLADLENEENIQVKHLAQAFGYREITWMEHAQD